jgi:hypothetical protein
VESAIWEFDPLTFFGVRPDVVVFVGGKRCDPSAGFMGTIEEVGEKWRFWGCAGKRCLGGLNRLRENFRFWMNLRKTSLSG